MKEAERLSAVNSIPSKFLKFVSSCLSSSARWFKCIYREFRRFSVCYKTHPAIYTLPFSLQLCYTPLGILQRVTKSQNVHMPSHDRLQKLHIINLALSRSHGFPGWGWNLLFFPLNTKFFKQ